ncbi:MAG TPA: aminodeoxychorismate lyase [Rhodanobacteraceae bacterium]|nr:aminodeoxychorismate lyase [Rhodanobacteraceae bacterium]
MTRRLVNGIPDGTLSPADRGFRYGDGLFETLRVVHGEAVLWSRHMARLAEGCRRLGLPLPDTALLWREARPLCDGLPQAALRLALSRGEGARGYAFEPGGAVTRVVEAAPAPGYPASDYRAGIRLFPCQTRLAPQPRLAGIKHANRLEQVLARAEWRDTAHSEGLMCDPDGHVISAIAANLFIVLDGHLLTPQLDRAGVAGVTRAEVLARRPGARERALPLADVLRADEVFLSSSLRGIVPVCAIGAAAFSPGPVTRALMAEWQAAGWMPEQDA